jgi:hypothetical protein
MAQMQSLSLVLSKAVLPFCGERAKEGGDLVPKIKIHSLSRRRAAAVKKPLLQANMRGVRPSYDNKMKREERGRPPDLCSPELRRRVTSPKLPSLAALWMGPVQRW